MKKILFVFALLVAGAIFLLVLNNNSGGSFKLPSFDVFGGSGSSGSEEGYTRVSASSNEDARFVNDRTIDFLEDIKFKDFDKAASYHNSEDRKKVNISRMIERIFAIKPEFLDIMSYEIVRIELDRSGSRARVHTRSKVKVLNTKEIRQPELIFYWHKDPKEGWVMKLESSLR
ncbi:MAG: hypothetical protein AB1758_20485 [Candidatus Eremiobacterota bacterium]